MDNKNLKTLGLFGLIGYLLSLPILIWKNSKIGKLIFSYVGILLALFLFSRVLDMAFVSYEKYEKIKSKEVIQERLKGFLEYERKVKTDLNTAREYLAKYDEYLGKKTSEAIEESRKALSLKLDFENRFKEIDEGISLIKEEERGIVKEKIITLKEQVKIFKKSIDSKEIRMACEEIADKTYLLSNEERQRFLKDLQDIGFGIENLQQETGRAIIYDVNSGGYNGYVWATCASADINMEMPHYEDRK